MFASAVILLIISLAYATATDLAYRRIPNKLTFPMLAGGLLLRAVSGGQSAFVTGLVGAAVAFGLMVIPFVMHWVGAGDAKLAMVVGVLMGPDFAVAALLFAAVVAGAIAAANIVRARQLASTAQYLLSDWRTPAPPGLAIKARLPYAPAIALGSLAALFPTALQALQGLAAM